MLRRPSVSRMRETARTLRKGDGETGSPREHRAPDYQWTAVTWWPLSKRPGRSR